MANGTEKSKAGQYLTLHLGTECYGVPIEMVREINRVGEITSVPKTPDYVKGVMNLRGKIIPVISLRLKFQMQPLENTRDTCIIVIDTPTGQVGMIVDSVKEVVSLKEDQIAVSPELGNTESMRFVTGMGKLEDKVIILLDVVSALSMKDLTLFKEMERESA